MRLEVLTPRGPLVKAEVDEVSAPGVRGEFGVLPGHIPFLTALKPGVLRYHGKDGSGVVAVGSGFAEVSSDRVAILVGTAAAPKAQAEELARTLGVRVEAIDVEAAKKELASTVKELETWTSDDAGARANVESQRDWAQARLDAAGASATDSH